MDFTSDLLAHSRRLLADAWCHRKTLAALWLTLVLVLGALALMLPARYSSSTSLFVEERNVLGPLMEGAAVQADVVDRARLARELVHARALLADVLRRNGLVDEHSSARELEQRIADLSNRVRVTTPGKNLIRLEYHDQSAAMAQAIVADVADAYIDASHAQRIEEARNAYNFIQAQVDQYQQLLDQSEHRLKQFRATEDAARPGIEIESGRRVAELRSRTEEIEQRLAEAKVQVASLGEQLNASARADKGSAAAQGKLRQLFELRAELEQLRLSYTETYPDVVSLKRQVAQLEREIAALSPEEQFALDGRGTVIEDQLTLQGKLKKDHLDAQTEVQRLKSRLASSRDLLAQEIERSQNIAAAEGQLVELQRDYDINMNLHKDLLQRRENARISLDLARARQGLIMRVDEPAYLPQSPSGVQGLFLLLLAPIVAALLPLGGLFAWNQLDWRLRHRADVEAVCSVPVFGVAHYAALADQRAAALNTRWAMYLMAAGCGVFALFLSLEIFSTLGGGA